MIIISLYRIGSDSNVMLIKFWIINFKLLTLAELFLNFILNY